MPKGYAKRKYDEMTKEEQIVIDSFEGKEIYQKTMQESNYYLFDAGKSVPILSGGNYEIKE